MIRRFDGAVGSVAAGWLTPTMTSPTVNAAERAAVAVLAAIEYVAVPEPLVPPVMVAHVWFDDTLHEQFDAVVTVIVPVAPVGAAVISDGVTVNVQVALCSVMVKARPAMVSVVVRESVPVFAAAV
jgi:hypothetical protein